MKIIDAIKNERGNPFWIPGAIREDIPEFLTQMEFKKGVEVGVAWAQNIVAYCKAGLEIYGIDPWIKTKDIKFRKIISIEGKYGSTPEGVKQLAIERTKDFPNCKLIQKTSMEALDDFADRSLDFVYIDADHSFGHVAMDLDKWKNKVKKGGAIMGHDYLFTPNPRPFRGAKYAIEAFARTYDFENWYVVGKPEESSRHDPSLSFIFIKHW
jgi:hypothetical protein